MALALSSTLTEDPKSPQYLSFRALLAANPRVKAFYEKDPAGTSKILQLVISTWDKDAISEEGLLDSSAMVGILMPRLPTVTAAVVIPSHDEHTPKRRKVSELPDFDAVTSIKQQQSPTTVTNNIFVSPQPAAKGTPGGDGASPQLSAAKKPLTGVHPLEDLEYTAMLHLAASGLASPAQLIALQQKLAERSLLSPEGLALSKPRDQPSLPSRVDDKEERIRALRKLSPAVIIRNSIEEMVLERRPAYRPRLGGRLAQAFVNPRGPFGTGAASDALDACLGEFKRDYPNLHAEVLANKGLFPEAKEKWGQDCLYHAFCYWTRRLIRPVLIAQVDAWRRELAVVDQEAAPYRYGPEDLDKELRGLKDIGGQSDGEWFITPAWKDETKKRSNPKPRQ